MKGARYIKLANERVGLDARPEGLLRPMHLLVILAIALFVV
jgi:hypothetical protein